jgi:hypothetical protein
VQLEPISLRFVGHFLDLPWSLFLSLSLGKKTLSEAVLVSRRQTEYANNDTSFTKPKRKQKQKESKAVLNRVFSGFFFFGWAFSGFNNLDTYRFTIWLEVFCVRACRSVLLLSSGFTLLADLVAEKLFGIGPGGILRPIGINFSFVLLHKYLTIPIASRLCAEKTPLECR